MAKKVAGEVAPLLCWRCEKVIADRAGPGTSIRCMRCGARTNVPEMEKEPAKP